MSEQPVLRLPGRVAQAAPADEITFIGTATTLIRMAGFTILTDPNFLHRGDRAYVGLGLTTKRLLRMYITGDTLMHGGIHEIAARFGDIDLCLIHLGGTRIAGILLTMDGRQGVEALGVVAPREAIPIHYDDYTLFKSPLSDFRRAVAESRLPAKVGVHYLNRGESYALGNYQPRR